MPMKSAMTNAAVSEIMLLDDRHIKALDKAETWMFHLDFCPYLELKELFSGATPEARERFIYLFTIYYGLNTGGLTDEFKRTFFDLMFDGSVIKDGELDYSTLLTTLSAIKRKTGDCAMPFSFASKLVAMNCESCPIYDRHVLNFFGGKAPPTSINKEKRIEWFVGFLARVCASYKEWAKDERVRPILKRLKARDAGLEKCDDVRLLDFLVWKVGSQKFLAH